jgi:prolyl-tRNA synthetase
MRYSALLAPTLKEVPKEAEVISHQLLLRAGYMRKVAAGIYSYMPLGVRVIERVKTIIREEMTRSGAQEVFLPAVQPAELWKESERWGYYGPELLRVKDRKGGDFCIGPTHEEVMTALVRDDIKSYRQLPLNLFQIQTKFRDEVRPRAGLLRGREFIMKDGYSFDIDEEAAKKTYQVMYDAYVRIFDRCGLSYRPVEADTGNIGGNMSHEFQVLADSGEDSIVSCASCNYTANVEKAELQQVDDSAFVAPAGSYEKRHTPNVRTVEEVARFLGLPTSNIIKTILYLADEQPVAVLMRGDLEVNEVKVKAALKATTLLLANEATVLEITGAPVGFAGPIGLRCRLLADPSVRTVVGGAVGANELDHHFVGVSIPRDLPEVTYTDLRLAGAGDACGRCGGTFAFFKGIEVGQVFYLGTKYSAKMKAQVLNDKGEENPMVMGCYGIGVTRTMAAAIEQNHDKDGIVWPMALAPYQVIIAPLQLHEPAVVEEAERIYRELSAAGVDVILDDRDLRPGVKLKDADLIGIPLRITIGARSLAEGKVEFKLRRHAEATLISSADITAETLKTIASERGAAAE